LRLYLEYPFPDSSYKGINLFDTPGFNALNAEHEEVLREFIPNSDMIIFTVSYRVGFGIEDQRLMQLVGNIYDMDEAAPVLLAINRTPNTVSLKEKRVKEIILNAKDSLHRDLNAYLVPSVIVDEETGVIPILPKTEAIWRDIRIMALSEERLLSIRKKNQMILNKAAEEMKADFRRRITAASIDVEEIIALENEKLDIKKTLNESQLIVDKYMDILKRNVPKMLEDGSRTLDKQLSEDIQNSTKWTDASLCAAYIAGHGLPFGIGKIVNQIEEYISQELERLDQEISEKANKTIQRINTKVRQFEKPELADLYKDIALKMGIQFTKAGANSFMKGFGGVGGPAAGAGNLLKMLVSRFGKLFGKTFSRKIYTQIGKVFTKEFLKRLNVAVTIAVEVIGFIWDANRWQGQLVKIVKTNIDNWANESINAFNDKMMAEYSEANHELVNEIFESMIQTIEQDIENIRNKPNEEEIAQLQLKIKSIESYQNEMEAI
jgi:hypothetical protein